MNRPPRLNHGTLADPLPAGGEVSPARGRPVTGSDGDIDCPPLLAVEAPATPKETSGPLSDGEYGSPE